MMLQPHSAVPAQLQLASAAFDSEKIATLDDAFIDPPPAASTKLSKAITVPLEDDDRALLVTVHLDGHQKTKLILDTGATYTSISRELAEDLGYDLDHCPRVAITTANGLVMLPKIKLRRLTINGFTANNVEATVMNMPRNIPFQGLLGLSFIKNHRITIDSEADKLVIEPSAA